jgi:hypothetical protein
MSEDSGARPVAPVSGPGLWASIAEPLIERTKQAVHNAVEEAVREYGTGMVAEARQKLKAAVDGLVAVQVEKLVQQLGPGSDAAKRATEGWLRDLREFANTTLADLFEKRVPEYSRWAGQRVLDYALVGILFAVAVVLLFAGGILGLHELGLPPYATFLIGGVVALAFGFWMLRMRPRPEPPGVMKSDWKPPGV